MAAAIKEIDLVEVGKYVHLRVTGKLSAEDYELFVPLIEEQIKNFGKINLLVELVDFHGWTAGALWEDTKFAVHHFTDIKRLAIVGDQAWEKGLTYFAKPFTLAAVKYFDVSEKDKAQEWILEGL